MKLAALTAIAVALTAVAPAAAQHATTVTTVHRVNSPVHILPHHNRKVCQYKWVARHRVKKCYYR
jgi:hypothetical protein